MRGGGGRRRLSLLFMMVKSSKSNYPKHEDIRVGWLCCTGKDHCILFVSTARLSVRYLMNPWVTVPTRVKAGWALSHRLPLHTQKYIKLLPA